MIGPKSSILRAGVALAVMLLVPPGAAVAADGVAAISAGGDHACALLSDRTVSCWGKDLSGQLGDGTTGDPTAHLRLIPVKVQQGGSDMTNVKAVSAGGAHTCALKTDGTVWCWGFALFGQVGNGTVGDGLKQLIPVQVQRAAGPLTGITQISAGQVHTCARRDDGTAWCWGHDDFGQVGDGTFGDGTNHVRLIASKVRRSGGSLTGITQVTAGNQHSCARRSDGTAWCWGLAADGQVGDGTFGDPSTAARPKAVQVRQGTGFLTGVKSISSGNTFSCARKADGTAWCWGTRTYGRLGDGDTTGRSKKAVQVRRRNGPLGGVTAIDAGGAQACARRTDATLRCWGLANDGEVGDGTTGNSAHVRSKAVQVIRNASPFTKVERVSAGGHFNCAVRSDSNAWCWGRNSSGQLGTRAVDTNPHPEPERVLFP